MWMSLFVFVSRSSIKSVTITVIAVTTTLCLNLFKDIINSTVSLRFFWQPVKLKCSPWQVLLLHLCAQSCCDPLSLCVLSSLLQEWVVTWLPSRPAGSPPTCTSGPSQGCCPSRWSSTGPIPASPSSPQVTLTCWTKVWASHINVKLKIGLLGAVFWCFWCLLALCFWVSLF